MATWLQIVSAFSNFCDSYGNIASVSGLLVSLVGFWITILSVVTAKQAAQNAETAARQAKEKVFKQGTLANFSSAIAVMEELIRLQRKKEWSNSLDRHSELRRILVELKDGGSCLTSEQQTIVQGVIEQFNGIERLIEKHVSDGKPEPQSAKINEVVKNQISKMQGVSITLKNN
jgi:hypothetical protein